MLLWLLMAISFIVFIEPAPYDILGLALLLAFLLLGLRIPTGIRYAMIFLGVFYVASILASILSPEPSVSIRPLMIRFYLLASWLLFTSLIHEDPDRVLRVLFSGYTAAAILAVALGVLGYFRLIPYTEQLLENGRVRSLFKDPNVYGPFLVPVMLYLVARMETATRIGKFYLVSVFAFLALGILLGFSRGSWLNLAAALLIYFVLRLATQKSARLKSQLIIQGSVLAAFLALVVGWAMTTGDIGRMLEIRTQMQEYDLKEGGRFSTQKQILRETLDYPLGIGVHQIAEPYYDFYRAPHNVYLLALIESGWLGALAFYGFLVLTLWKSFQFVFHDTGLQAVYIAVFASACGVLLQSLFVDSHHWRHVYLLYAMLWGPLPIWLAGFGNLRALRGIHFTNN
ncbi:MAG: O-antigen ligase family protein [Gammaproteobacteria bacterium]